MVTAPTLAQRRRHAVWAAAAGLIALAALLATALLPRARAPVLRHEAYVWQRQWDDSLRAAVRDSRDVFAGLRVLALQVDATATWVEPAVDVAALAADQRDVVMVVRIDGSAPRLAAGVIADRVLPLQQRWQAAGVRVRGIEIDHDCATARLPHYALQLQALRGLVPTALSLSITALPDWREAPALDQVLAAVDASVLQVHAVQDPQRGLFDPVLAQQWIARWAQRSAARPFLVALPAYGVKLKLDDAGDLLAVESEQVLPQRTAASREVQVDPRAVAGVLAQLQSARFPQLVGVIWFRLPRARDQRAWSLHTLRALIAQQPLQAVLQARIDVASQGALDLSLASTGTLDALLPRSIDVIGQCSVGDGINGYALRQLPQAMRFERETSGSVRAGQQRKIGWLRCDSPSEVSVHVLD